MRLSLTITLLLSFACTAIAYVPARIIFAGNTSVLAGVSASAKNGSYASALQKILGAAYIVSDFQANTAFSSKAADYLHSAEYLKALKSGPSLVFVSPGNSGFDNAADTVLFYEHFKTLVKNFRGLSSHPRIVLLYPFNVSADNTPVHENLRKYFIPLVQRIAFEQQIETIDLYALFSKQPDLIPAQPAKKNDLDILVSRLAEAIKMHGSTGFDIFKKISEPYSISSFNGYECADFVFMNRACKIVKPRITARGMPWIWRARFWGHEPQTDIALLDRGFHVVYCDVAELYGNRQAISIWTAFYEYLQTRGLAAKAVMEGMSRGGVYIYNWAAINPGKIACVYADAPVLDLRSWPGGKGKGPGSAKDWEIFKQDYNITEEEASRFEDNPLNKTKQIVEGKYPLLHVVGDADDLVPVDENTTPFQQKIIALKGNMQVIHKPGIGHHPHSLPDPTPIVDFILKAVKYQYR
jgi:hypothetical protein